MRLQKPQISIKLNGFFQPYLLVGMDHVEDLVKVAKPLRTGVFHDDGMFRLAGKAGIILNLRNGLDHNPLGTFMPATYH
jgi:hypothetical protein